MKYNRMLCNALQYNAMQYNAMQDKSRVQYSIESQNKKKTVLRKVY